MFLLGIKLGGENFLNTYIFLKRIRKNLKKYYHIISIKQYDKRTDLTVVEEEAVNIYNDEKYIIKKPRFSQDKRPVKTVYANPVILVNPSGAHAEKDFIRRKDVPAEVFFYIKGEKWEIENDERHLGHNFYIPEHILLQDLIRVINDNRLIIKNIPDFSSSLAKELKKLQCLGTDMKEDIFPSIDNFENKDILLSMSMPVWFYENYLDIRSSGRSKYGERR